MTDVIRSKSIKKHTDHLASRRAARQRAGALKRKTFEQLSEAERDRLLKVLLVRMGFVQDSPDV